MVLFVIRKKNTKYIHLKLRTIVFIRKEFSRVTPVIGVKRKNILRLV